MAWNIFWAALVVLSGSGSAWVGWEMTGESVSPRARKWTRFGFVAFALIGIVAVCILTYRSGRIERVHFRQTIATTYHPILTVDKPLSFNAVVENVGNGSGYETRNIGISCLEYDMSTVSQDDCIAQLYKAIKSRHPFSEGGGTVQKGQQEFISMQGPILSPEDIANVELGRRVIHLVASTFWVDDFGKHTQSFCGMILPPNVTGALERHLPR